MSNWWDWLIVVGTGLGIFVAGFLFQRWLDRP